MNNLYAFCFCLCFISVEARGQNTAFDLLDQRLEDIRRDSKALEDKQKELSGQVRALEIENKRFRFNTAYHKKELIRNETELKQKIQELYNTENSLRVKIAETSVLEQQVRLLQSEKDSLSQQLGELAQTDSILKTQFENTQTELSQISREFEKIKEAAKYESLANSLRYPRGYHKKKLSIAIIEGGLLNLVQGFSTSASFYSYLVPSRNVLGGFGLGADFYTEYKNDGQNLGSFFLAPVTLSVRGNFGPQDFFTVKRDTVSKRFNMNWMVDFGWSLLVKDTDAADSFGGNFVMSGGVGALWPQYRTFGLGVSAIIKAQRLKKVDTLGNSDAIVLPMLVIKMSFYLRK